MKTVFMGTPDFAAGILQALLDSEYEVTAVFSQPDKPKGRKAVLQAPPVKELALQHKIPVYQPAKIRTEENVQILRDLAPDFIVVAAFGQIIPKSILDIPRFGCLNVHASLLPAWRGAAPIQWAIMNGDRETGVTIMRMDPGLDTGDIITQKTVPIAEDETGGSLFDKMMVTGAEEIIKTMRLIEAGEAVYTPQPEQSSTPYAKMLDRKSGLIDWSLPAVQIERMIRGLDPWPGSYTYEHGKMLKIWKAEVIGAGEDAADNGAGKSAEPEADGTDSAGPAAGAPGGDLSTGSSHIVPGTIVRVTKDALQVQTGDGILSVLEIQPEGKKRMAVDAFLRGYRQTEGELLGKEDKQQS